MVMSNKKNVANGGVFIMNNKYSLYIKMKCFLIKHFMETKIWVDLLPVWILLILFFIPFNIGFLIGIIL